MRYVERRPKRPAWSCLSIKIPRRIHVLKLPRRVDMQQRKWRWRREERLLRQMQHNGRILTHRIKHDRVFCLSDQLSHDLNAFRFEAFQVGEIHYANSKKFVIIQAHAR